MARKSTIIGIAARKPLDMDDARGVVQYETDRRVWQIAGSITVTNEIMDQLEADLSSSHEVWAAARDLQDDKRILDYNVVRIQTPGFQRRIFVDTQGYDYARYVIIPA